MTTRHSQPAKAFRPGNPREYDFAVQVLAEHGRTVGDFLSACLRWLNREPDNALNTLAAVWPPQRATGRRTWATAYAVLDESGQWFGRPDLLPVGQFRDLRMSHAFEPADPYNPRGGQALVFRVGAVGDDVATTPYAVRVLGDDGNEAAVPIAEVVHDTLFGPPITGSKAWAEWDKARDQRKRELESKEGD